MVVFITITIIIITIINIFNFLFYQKIINKQSVNINYFLSICLRIYNLRA